MRSNLMFLPTKVIRQETNPDQKSHNYLDQFKYKICLQVISVIICSMCFIFQSSQLISLYLSGKTIVENRVERFKYSPLPAITICLPTFMDMEKFADYWLKNHSNQEFRGFYKEFEELKDMVKANQWSDETHEKQRLLFEKFLWNSYIKASNFSIKESFDKFSVNITMTNRTQLDSLSRAFNERGQLISLPLPKQITSMVALLDPRKCITLFSDFDDYYRNLKLNIIQMELLFKHNKITFPSIRYYEGEFYISLHSPNILPDYKRENVFQKLKMGMLNFITYSESQTRLLPAPYQTNCLEYNQTDSEESDTRSDCIEKCVDERLIRKFNLKCVWSYDNLKLIRPEIVLKISKKPICDHQKEPRIWEIVDEQHRFENECEELCPRNCFETFYSYEIETRNGHLYREEHNHFSINIDHNRFPDQVIEHKPIMDWITLVSNLGGLLGMWMGLSVLFICNKFINKLFDKKFKFKRHSLFTRVKPNDSRLKHY